MRYYIIAGEASGDLHGSNLMKGLKEKDQQAEFRFFGGDLMESEGGNLVRHYRNMAFMGFFDVLANLRTIARNLAFCKKDILDWSPDVVILIDYPGFNLKIAEFAHKNRIKVFYYISPKVWAWRKSRVKKLKIFVDRLFVIFPFEVEFFRRHGIGVDYYGNPLLDAIGQFRRNAGGSTEGVAYPDDKRPLVALLAGSRISEIKHCLPEMVKAAAYFPSYRFVVAAVNTVDEKLYREILAGSEIQLVKNQTYSLLEHSSAAVVTSGTATLETALFNVPQVVVYKTGSLTYHLGKLFVKVRFFSLVNIIAGKEVVKELLQQNLAERIREELELILGNTEYRNRMLSDYQNISSSLGEQGVSQKIASGMIDLLKQER